MNTISFHDQLIEGKVVIEDDNVEEAAILAKHDESAWFPDASFNNIYWYVSIS